MLGQAAVLVLVGRVQDLVWLALFFFLGGGGGGVGVNSGSWLGDFFFGGGEGGRDFFV